MTINNNQAINASEINDNSSVVINAGGTLNMNVPRTFNNITSANAGVSTINGTAQLTATGVLTINANNTLSVATAVQCNTLVTGVLAEEFATLSGTGTISANTITINGSPGWDADMVINTGLTVQVTDINGGSGGSGTDHDLRVNGTLKILGNVTGLETFICGLNSKIIFAGGNQTIPVVTYYHLELTGTGIKTLSDYTIIDGDLLVETGTTLTLGGATLTMNSPDARTATINGTLNINGDGRLAKPTAANKTLVLGPQGVINITDVQGGIGNGGVQMPSFGIYNLARTSTVHYGSNEGQSITDIPYPGYGNLVLSGSGNKAPSFSLDIQGDFILQSATFWPWDMTHTLKGNWIKNGGTFNYDGGRIVFAGSTPQTIGGTQPTTFWNVTFANTNGGITLLQPTSIAKNATLTSGVVTSSATNPLIFNDEATSSLLASNATTTSYVNGPVKKIGNNAFVFPIGAATGFVPLAISAPDNDADAFTAQYFRGAPADRGDITAPGIDHISSCDYWDLTETVDAGAATTINVTFYWNANNPCTGASSYVTDPTKIKLVHFTGGSWSASSTGVGSGTAASGSVTFSDLLTFSPFALASTTPEDNPLPVVFGDVKAYEKSDGVQIEWSNLTEKDVAEYTIERSTNGRDFSPIAKQLPNSNQDDKESYVAFDAVPNAGANYYRIKAEETTGRIVYSKILSVKLDNNDAGLKLYPNPASGNQITINLSNVKNGKYNLRVVNAAGQVIFKQVINNQSNNMTQTLDLPSTIKAGVYNLIVASDNYRVTKIFIVQ